MKLIALALLLLVPIVCRAQSMPKHIKIDGKVWQVEQYSQPVPGTSSTGKIFIGYTWCGIKTIAVVTNMKYNDRSVEEVLTHEIFHALTECRGTSIEKVDTKDANLHVEIDALAEKFTKVLVDNPQLARFLGRARKQVDVPQPFVNQDRLKQAITTATPFKY